MKSLEKILFVCDRQCATDCQVLSYCKIKFWQIDLMCVKITKVSRIQQILLSQF